MKRALFLTIVSLVVVGCTSYSERFTYSARHPVYTNEIQQHTVDISHQTFLMWGRASVLSTETQTGEFIRTVNAEELSFGVETNAIKSLSEGIAEGVVSGIIGKP
jgi:hypothetical protein